MIRLPNINTVDQERVIAFLLRFLMCGPGYVRGWMDTVSHTSYCSCKLTPLCTGIINGVKHQSTLFPWRLEGLKCQWAISSWVDLAEVPTTVDEW